MISDYLLDEVAIGITFEVVAASVFELCNGQCLDSIKNSDEIISQRFNILDLPLNMTYSSVSSREHEQVHKVHGDGLHELLALGAEHLPEGVIEAGVKLVSGRFLLLKACLLVFILHLQVARCRYRIL